MPYRPKPSAVPSLMSAGLAALLGIPDASAQERITLETIGAVRMARTGEVRGARPEPRPADTAPARAQLAERTSHPR